MKLPEKLSLKGYWGTVMMMIFLLVIYHQSGEHMKAEATQAAMMPMIPLPANIPAGVGRMVGQRRVFVGGQLIAEELTTFLASYQVDHVIDLAAEAKAEAILPTATERDIVERSGATYWPFNIEGRAGQLNQAVLTQIDSLLDSGEVVFVHCQHGIHRVGVAKGRAYARDGLPFNEIVQRLGWQKVVGDVKYRKYVNDVFQQAENYSK